MSPERISRADWRMRRAMRWVGVCAAGVVCASAQAALGAERWVSLPTRPGVEQRFLFDPAERPMAAAILFAGGHGALRLSGAADRPSIGWGEDDFLVRTRHDFARAGLAVATVDAPSDRQGERGMLGGFRAGAEHCRDIEAVVRWLRQQQKLPLWLIGAGRGTESATNCAIRLAGAIDGLVLASPLTRGNRSGVHVTAMDLGKIRVPTLVVVHELDECEHAPASGGHVVLSALTQAPRKELKSLRGGARPRAKPCQGLSAHGFLGVEAQAVQAISSFVKAPSPADHRSP
jgi:alpha/beta superfamily hydrolase